MWVEADLTCGAEASEDLICAFLMSSSALGNGVLMRNRWRAEGRGSKRLKRLNLIGLCSSLRRKADTSETGLSSDKECVKVCARVCEL